MTSPHQKTTTKGQMMSEFQIGQKVQALRWHGIFRQGVASPLVNVGDTGEILDVERDDETGDVWQFGVSFKGVDDLIWYRPTELRAVVTAEETLARIADTLDRLLGQDKAAEVASALYTRGDITLGTWRGGNDLEPEKGEVKRKAKDLKVEDEFILSGPSNAAARFGKHEFTTQPVHAIKYLQNNIIELFRADDTRFWIGNAEDEVRVYVG